MISADNLLAFIGTALLLAFVPGPDNLFVMTQAAVRGWRLGVTVVLGLCTGLIVHTTAVALGVAVIFQSSAWAFDLLKYAGSAYLLYLAWQAFRAKATVADDESSPRMAVRQFYLRGIVMNITNPKVSIFFLAFLPQFVDHTSGRVTMQLFMLGGLFIVCTLVAFTLMAVLAARAGARFGQSAAAQKSMNTLAGVVFVALAAKLALTQR